MQLKVKICGISTLDAAKAAINDSADFLGFIHFAKSPRHLPLNAMADLIKVIRSGSGKTSLVSVVVNPDNELLLTLKNDVQPDMIQLHGSETVERVAQIAALTNIPLIKAISVREAADLDIAKAYEPHVAHLLFDAKVPEGAPMPGGLGLRFDWTIMRKFSAEKPWFLAGGLTLDSLPRAITESATKMLDVSSGVENAPGIKDAALISSFLRAAKAL